MTSPEHETIDSILASDELSDDEKTRWRNEKLLGSAALLAQRRGRDDLASDILMVSKLNVEWVTQEWDDRDAIAIIEVETENITRFTDQLLTDILETLKSVDQNDDRDLTQIVLKERVPPVPLNWRELVQQAISEPPKANNQGRSVRHNVKRFEEDGLQFSNALEVRFYGLLKEKQESLPETESLSIFPLPAQRIVGRNFEPDFLVVYEGRAAIIELDGGNHSRRVAADQSRDRLMKNAGFRLIERLAVEDVQSADEVRAFIDSVLKRLAKS
ncbi:DUF559 domain-containing protein [Actinoplanes siamensis]|uniref:DUF559 domain-containing protein n=1 Tax=Actinoplanes siamensis TaxID=1223317 RepID=A0A919N5D0_9ACTN|nr:DUF559 domain-containing protein [Actinoplanes siamensis]GIF04683.1 hypothetical protein Asi03nite_22210 [Actinoplanes siamensis]